MKINNLQGGYSKWNTVILSDEHSSAGSASYSEKPSPELLIKLGSNELRAEVTQGDFANGGGTIFYNGERIGNWFGKIPGRLTVMDTRRITILRLEEDDWSRRFKWAYRNGLSWRQAWRYASWGYLLIGKNYALASIIDPHFNWEFAASHPPFNEEDHQMVCSLPPQEQLLVLFVVLRRFGGLFRGDIKRGFGNTCPNVRSFIRIDKGGQPCLTLDPGKLPSGRRISRRIGEWMATGHPICWTCIAICLYSGIFGLGKGTAAGGIIFSMVFAGYIIVSRLMSSRHARDILCTPAAEKETPSEHGSTP